MHAWLPGLAGAATTSDVSDDVLYDFTLTPQLAVNDRKSRTSTINNNALTLKLPFAKPDAAAARIAIGHPQFVTRWPMMPMQTHEIPTGTA